MPNSALKMKLSLIALLVLAVVIAVAPSAQAAVSCNSVYNALSPCLGYIGGSGPPSAGCCSAVRSLAGSANTKADRQSICGCIKSLAQTYPTRVPRANDLLKTCRVTINFPISPTVDCSRVN